MVTFNYKWMIFFLPAIYHVHFLLEHPTKGNGNHGSSICTSANQTTRRQCRMVRECVIFYLRS